jgi:predicted nucleotidyltransferase
MRLANADRNLITETVRTILGPDAVVRLFGSRLDDGRRGGDIDLFVEVSTPLTQRVMTACRLAAQLERALDGRRVDVLLSDPLTPQSPVHRAARENGVAL